MLKFETLRDSCYFALNKCEHSFISASFGVTPQADMKKVNDSASVSSGAKASFSAENIIGSDMSVDARTSAAIGSIERSDSPATETVKPKINKRSRSKPKVEETNVSAAKSRSIDRAVSSAIGDADCSLMGSEDQTISSASKYRPVGQSGDRIAIFIDGSNLFYAASHLNIEVDYRRLLTTLVGDRRLLRAYFYTGVDPQNEKQRGFLLWLNRHGHRVVSKELTNMPDGSRKANMHVEMAVDMMRIAEHCPTITLLGGDGNLAYALEALSQRGISLEVVSLQSMTSDSLIDLADSYVDLADLRDEIKR